MPAEIGIMFVHGIGSQTRGETLVNFGEPFYKTLKDWVESGIPNEHVIFDHKEEAPDKQGGQVQLIDSFLSPLLNEPSQQAEPAHVRLRIATNLDTPVEWVLAECHWATSFPPPRPREVTLWIMRVLPWIFTSFVCRRLRMATNAILTTMTNSPRHWLEVIRLSVSMLLLILALPLISPTVLLLELCLVALLVVQLVPLKVVQDVVTRINTAISAVLGDSFIFASSELRQQAVSTKLSRDLMWLESKFGCKSIVVIAHSQGAAITYLALKNFGLGKVKLLVTAGAGIVKLFQLESRTLKWLVDMLALVVPSTGASTFVVAAVWLGFHRLTPDNVSLAKWSAGVGIVGWLIIALWIASEEHTEEIRKQASKFAQNGLKWIDLYASMDPVPNGPLLLPASADVESVQLCNQSSLLADHTSYAGNREECLLSIVDAIVRYSGTKLKVIPLLEPTRMLAKGIRRIKISSEQIDKTILLVALIAFLLNREEVEFVGSWLSRWIDAGCHRAGVGSCWHYSSSATGLGAALAAFVFLRMLVQGYRFVADRMMKDFAKDFGPFVDFAFVRHACACLALSLALSLYHPQTFAWIEWLYRQVPDFYWSSAILGQPSPWFFQTIVFGMAAAVILWLRDWARVSRQMRRWQRAKEAYRKSHIAAA